LSSNKVVEEADNTGVVTKTLVDIKKIAMNKIFARCLMLILLHMPCIIGL
jgi:hypothetical protein